MVEMYIKTKKKRKKLNKVDRNTFVCYNNSNLGVSATQQVRMD